jgi:PleD family two-component response regulator
MRGARKFCNSVHMAFGVLIVDDNRLFLEAARALLEREGLRVVGVAATSTEALQRAEELRAGSIWPGSWPGSSGAASLL